MHGRTDVFIFLFVCPLGSRFFDALPMHYSYQLFVVCMALYSSPIHLPIIWTGEMTRVRWTSKKSRFYIYFKLLLNFSWGSAHELICMVNQNIIFLPFSSVQLWHETVGLLFLINILLLGHAAWSRSVSVKQWWRWIYRFQLNVFVIHISNLYCTVLRKEG